jgi:hypothetical protein
VGPTELVTVADRSVGNSGGPERARTRQPGIDYNAPMHHLLLLAALVGLASCASTAAKPVGEALTVATGQPQTARVRPVASRPPAIAVIQTRNEKLEVRSLDGELRFTVQDSDGRLLADDLAAEALADRFPALYTKYRAGLARLSGE